MIIQETPEMERIAVVGCALTPDLGRVSLRKIPNRPGIQGEIFNKISEASILVDDIMQIEYGELADISFTVTADEIDNIRNVAQKFLNELGAGTLAFETGLAKVSVVGVGMRTHTGVASIMFNALGKAGINIANVTTSEIKLSCIVSSHDGERALQTVHDAFELHKSPESRRVEGIIPMDSLQTQ